MRRSSFRDGFATRPLLRRLDRAAGQMTPYLMVLAIGLTLLNLAGLVLRIPRLSFTHGPPAAGCAPAQSANGTTSDSDAALRAGS